MLMPFNSVNTTKNTGEAFSKIQQIIMTNGLKIKSTVPNQSVQAEGKRDYGLAALIILIVIIWPVGLIYYFTRKKNSVSVLLSPIGDGCRADITYDGETGGIVSQLIVNSLQ